MNTTPAMPTARKRRRKTRTKRVSHRPPIVASTLKANEIDLFPGKEHLVCPDCKTWCPITGVRGKTPKLVPHHTERAGTPDPRRCSGSDRLVDIDVAVGEWRTELVEAVLSTKSRRANRVNRKPRTTTAQPVSRLATAPKESALRLPALLEAARTAVAQHRDSCRVCRKGGRCETGGELERWQAETEASSRFAREQRQRTERQLHRGVPAKRTAEWGTVAASVSRSDVQRLRDELNATLRQLSPSLDRFGRAELDSRIIALTRALYHPQPRK